MHGASSQGLQYALNAAIQARNVETPAKPPRARSVAAGVRASSEARPPAAVDRETPSLSRCVFCLVDSPEKAPRSPLVYAPYQHNPLKHWPESRPKFLQKDQLERGSMKVYPFGFSCTQDKLVVDDREQPAHLKDLKRGEITTLSRKSRQRLREFMLTHHREGCDPFSITMTTHQVYSPEQWESIVKRFRTSLARKFPDWPACWRVELQTRQTPHLHTLFYAPKELPAHVVRECIANLWLKASREDQDRHAQKHSVFCSEGYDGGWIRYITLHSSKHKQEQLGWKGRQWGIWNAKAWQDVEPLTEGELTHGQRVQLARRLRAHSRNRLGKKRRVKPLKFYATRNMIAHVMKASVLGQLLRGIVESNQ